jgi:hypothetical protein
MSSSISDFPPVDLGQWKARLEKELKAPLRFEDLQWKVSDMFSLDPLFGPESLDLQYLKNFHEKWKSSGPAARARISVGTHAMLSQHQEVWNIAESYGFQSWFGPTPDSAVKAGLPLCSRSNGQEPDPVMDGLALGKWQGNFSEQSAVLHVHGLDVHEAGGSMVQELATLLLVSDHYLAASESWPGMVWHLGTGTSFWIEMVKCRTARLLWMNFAAFHQKDFKNFELMATTSTLSWTSGDVDMNLIRHAAEVMAAIMGGADEIRILPHSLDPVKALESTRLAANLALLAFEESHLDEHFDPASGSYWLENATDALARAVWDKFTSWHQAGLENLITSGRLVEEIRQSGMKWKEDVMAGTQILTGGNAFVSDMAQKSPDWPKRGEISGTEFPALRPLALKD